MKKQRYKNQTLSIELSQEFHTLVKRSEVSPFVAEAIQKGLQEAYLMANNDPGQKEAIEDWNATVSDGFVL
jgi:hypothetical protein